MSAEQSNKAMTPTRLRIRPTIYGWGLLFLVIWVPMAAIGTANNFLLIIFIMTAGLAVVSHRMAKRNLARPEVSRRFPEEIYADTTFPIQYLLKAKRKEAPAYALQLREAAPLEPTGAEATFYEALPDDPARVTAFFSIPSRGDKRIEPGVMASAFPFGLATYSQAAGPAESVLVFPRVEPVVEEILSQAGIAGTGTERSDPFGVVPFHFREYLPGDQFKHIDWKKSARTGGLITRILSDEASSGIIVSLPRGASERAISRAASLVVHFTRNGTPVSLRGPGLVSEAGYGEEFARSLLTLLARWDSSAGDDSTGEHAMSRGIVVRVDESGEFHWNEPSRNQERQHE
jgi:uncharacterized protein (DUF58 family)